MTAPPEVSTVRVRYAETDQMRVAYHGNYFAWFEVARTDWLRRAGWTYREMEAEGCALPVLEAHCEYRQSARYDDTLAIAVTPRLVSPVRVRFDYTVTRADDGLLLAVAHTVHAAINADGRPQRLLERVVAMFPQAS